MPSRACLSSGDHSSFLEHTAKITPPKRLDTLLELLSLRGLKVTSPLERKGLNPLLIPLAKDSSSGSTVCYLRWPTQKENMDLQIVSTTEVGVTLLSTSTDQFCHRQVVEMDHAGSPLAPQAAALLNKHGQLHGIGDYLSFYKSGKFPVVTAQEQQLALDRYLLLKVGQFPDCYERLAGNFLAQGNEISALVTCERAVNVFYSWGQPLVFHSRLLSKLGRDKEAKETALSALALPKWTLATSQEDLHKITKTAGYTDSKVLGSMHVFRASDPRSKDQEEGVSKEQISLDQAAHLMDAVALGSVEGGWAAAKADIASKYRDGGYPDMAAFIEA